MMSDQNDEGSQSNIDVAKPNLTLQDLTLMAEIIQECTSRGVWQASELSSVGKLYDRLESFLTSAGIDLNKKSKGYVCTNM